MTADANFQIGRSPYGMHFGVGMLSFNPIAEDYLSRLRDAGFTVGPGYSHDVAVKMDCDGWLRAGAIFHAMLEEIRS